MSRGATDEFGIGAAARAGLAMYEGGARRSGRTMRLVERVQNGDTIICGSGAGADHIKRLCRDMGKHHVKVVCTDPRRVPMERVGTAPHGRVYFDHHWLYQFYMDVIDKAEQEIQLYHGAMSKTWPDKPEQTFDQAKAESTLEQGFRFLGPIEEYKG